MISIITRRHHELSATLEDDLGRYRHEVFIQQLGWQLDSTHARPQREFDQFDHADARHILALDAEHQVCGCARLLPTTQPYLLAQVFGFLCDQPTPPSSDTWEVSRFAARALEEGTLPMRVWWNSLNHAWSQGANRVVAVTTPALERYFLRHGVQLSRLGSPQRVNKDHVVALSFPAWQKNGQIALHAESAVA